MANEIVRRILAARVEDDVLCHHGILNMSWGVRNGPPYPLSGAGKKMSSFLRKKKRQYAIASKAKKTAKEQRAQDAINLKKQKLLAKGDMNAIYRNAKIFTNDELAMALERNQLMFDTKHAKNRRKAPDPHAFDSLVNATDKLGTAARNIAPALDVALKVADLTKKRSDAKAAEGDKAAKTVQDRFNMLKGIDEQAALDFFNDIYDTKYEKKKDAKAEAEREAEKKAKAVQDKFNMLKGLDDSAALELFNDLYGTDYKKKVVEPKFDKDKFEALTKINPASAAEYLSKAMGSTVSYDADAITKYMEAIGKSAGKPKT